GLSTWYLVLGAWSVLSPSSVLRPSSFVRRPSSVVRRPRSRDRPVGPGTKDLGRTRHQVPSTKDQIAEHTRDQIAEPPRERGPGAAGNSRHKAASSARADRLADRTSPNRRGGSSRCR